LRGHVSPAGFLRSRLGGLGAEPFLHRLLEAFDFALGLRMVWLAVLLLHPEAAQLAFVGVPAAGEAGGEDEPVEFLSGVKRSGWS
jgi:hypothetical protein